MTNSTAASSCQIASPTPIYLCEKGNSLHSVKRVSTSANRQGIPPSLKAGLA
jgi:hypothetical protein